MVQATFIFLLLFPWAVIAQNAKLSGRVRDAKDGVPLPGATINLVLTEDSTRSVGAVSRADGTFSIENLKAKAYRLRVSFVGYATLDTVVALKRGENGPLTVRLHEAEIELKDVKIEALRTPVELKGDTVEYSADGYKTGPDANAGDLINKMPGVSVEGNTVKAHGEEVKRVMVDGKPFFGNDPGAALKNLPAGAVDKVQVFDRPSDRARLTGVDDGQAERSINFVLKAEYKNGLFGRIYAGYGSNERYNAGFSVNRFKEKRRLTVVGLFNNVNLRNFSAEDLASLTTFSAQQGPGRGGGRTFAPSSGLLAPSFSGANGINRTEALGVNFNDEWKKIVVFSGDYTFNHATRTAEIFTNRTFFAGNLLYDETYRETATNPFHRYTLRAEITPDTANAVVVQSSGTFSFVRTDNQTLGFNRIGGETTSANENNVHNPYFLPNTQHTITFRHKFPKARRNFSIETTAKTSDNRAEHQMQSAHFSLRDTFAFRQIWRTTAPEYSAEANATYTEPLGKTSSMELSYAPQYHHRFRERMTDRLDYASGEFLFRDASLSFTLPSNVVQNTGKALFRFTPPKHYVHVGASVQHIHLTGGQTYPFDERFRRRHVYPMAHLGWRADWSRTKKLHLFYRPSVRVPSAFRFQTSLNNANPLSLSTGNVELRPEYEHGLRGFFSRNNPEKGRTLWVHWFANYVHDYIGGATYIARRDTFVNGNFLPGGGQFTRPENFAGYVLFRPMLSYGLTLSKIKSKLNLELTPNYTRTPGIFNDRFNVVQRLYIGGGFSLSGAVDEKIDYTLSYNGGYSFVFNGLAPGRKQDFYNHNLSAKSYWNFWQGAFVNVNLSQTLYSGGGFNRGFWLFSPAAGYKFFKDKSLTLQLEAFDVFNQNTGVSRTVNEAYIENVRNLVVNRYFMLSLVWQFKYYPNLDRRSERYIGE